MNSKRVSPPFLGVQADPAVQSSVAVLPLPYEGTVSWGKGTKHGPAALLEASVQLEFWDEVLEREPRLAGIVTLPAPRMPAAPEAAVRRARDTVRRVLNRGLFPVVVGGEHSLSYGVFQAMEEQYPGLGVVQFDAHADLRDTYEGTPFSHACVMRRIRHHTDAVLQIGIRSLSPEEAAWVRERGYRLGYMHQLRAGTFDVEAELRRLPYTIFLTFDVDALDPALIRSTGTPEPGGLGWDEVNRLLERVFALKQVVGLDLMELCPGDPASAFCAARLLYRMIGWAFPASGTSARRVSVPAHAPTAAAPAHPSSAASAATPRPRR